MLTYDYFKKRQKSDRNSWHSIRANLVYSPITNQNKEFKIYIRIQDFKN